MPSRKAPGGAMNTASGSPRSSISPRSSTMSSGRPGSSEAPRMLRSTIGIRSGPTDLGQPPVDPLCECGEPLPLVVGPTVVAGDLDVPLPDSRPPLVDVRTADEVDLRVPFAGLQYPLWRGRNTPRVVDPDPVAATLEFAQQPESLGAGEHRLLPEHDVGAVFAGGGAELCFESRRPRRARPL